MRLLRPAGEDRDDGTEKDDAALVRAVARADTDALGALYDRHAGWLHARLARRCADAETVREVLQDTFVTVWRSAASHRGAQVGGWLWVIASRRLVDALRADARADRPPSPVRPAPEALAPSAEDRVLAGLEYGDVGTALAGISPELREVLRATVVDGLSTREAAVLLGVPEGTVKTRAMRARRELRAALERLAPEGEVLGGTA
ncbi:RNA polymerase sigma factor [Streptomyces sp. NPDC006855]|uniref:RNA polymerase sigma factor n=1 Tax=Streptomyces sp. NPDC006855 TaxID=3364765 RepID=UPI0036AE1333